MDKLIKTVALLYVCWILGNVNCTETCADKPADIGFLLDASGSVGATNFDLVKSFVNNFILYFQIDQYATQISAFPFDDVVQTASGFHFSAQLSKQSVSLAIFNISYTNGGTDFDRPLTFAREQMFVATNGARASAKKILIFITDGQASITNEPGQLLRDQNVAVYVVAVGSGVNQEILRKIATNPSYIYTVDSFNLIKDVKETLTTQACKDIIEHTHPCTTTPDLCQNGGACVITATTAYKCICLNGFTGDNCQTDIDDCAGVICQNGGTCIDHVGYFTCACRQFFTGSNCETNMCEPHPADVVFVIDISASIETHYIRIAKQQIDLVTRDWIIDGRHFQIALVSFASTANIVLGFSDVTTKSRLMDEVLSLQPKQEQSNIHIGLLQAVDLLRLGRSVQKKIILFTDGFPSSPSEFQQYVNLLRNFNIYTVAIGYDVSHYFLSKMSNGLSFTFPHNTDRLWHHLMKDLILVECNACTVSKMTDIIVLVDTADIEEKVLISFVPKILMKILSRVRLNQTEAKLALITYGEVAKVRFTFDVYTEHNRTELTRTLSYYEAGRNVSSNITKALEVVHLLIKNNLDGARESAKKHILIFSEFKTSLNQYQRHLVEKLKNDGIEISTIGISNNEDSFNVMADLASTSYHIGTNGMLYFEQIDLFIDTFINRLTTLSCHLIN